MTKESAKKIQAGLYSYHGYTIQHMDTRIDDDGGYVYWTVIGLTDGTMAEGFNTKRQAMEFINDHMAEQ